MTITERYTDMAGNYRVMVEVDNTMAIPLKYKTTVADSVPLADAQALLDREAAAAVIAAWTTINYDL